MPPYRRLAESLDSQLASQASAVQTSWGTSVTAVGGLVVSVEESSLVIQVGHLPQAGPAVPWLPVAQVDLTQAVLAVLYLLLALVAVGRQPSRRPGLPLG